MSMSNVLLPQGGINSGSNIYVLGIYQNDLYALIRGSNTNEVIMVRVYTNSGSSSMLNPQLSNIIPFSVSYSGNAIILRATTSPMLYLSESSGILTLISSNPANFPLYFSQNTYTSFSAPSLLLSSVPYTLFGNTEESMIEVTLEDGMTVTMPIMVVPTSYFTSCSMGSNQSTSNLQSLMNVTYCSHFNSSWCNSVPRQGWTTQGDCLTGNTYTYCPNGISCSGNCKSGCFNSTENAVCTFQGNSYTCIDTTMNNNNDNMNNTVFVNTTPSTATLATPPPGLDWWWIIIIIVIVIVIAVLIFGAYHSRTSEHSDYAHHLHSHHSTSVTSPYPPHSNNIRYTRNPGRTVR